MIPSLLLAFQVSAAGSVGAGADPARAADLDVAIPRLEADLVVDGVLDEAVWAEAALLRGFHQYSPRDGVPASDSTRVWVWYAPDAIHFGIRAFADPTTVRATLAERDRIDNDDHVLILLDTFNDARRASVFGVNPFGIQMDGLRLEGEASGGGLRGEADVHPLDRNPDFNYESRGRLTDAGYEVEVRIPFKSLRYQSADEQDWGLNVVRVAQATGHSHTWTPARRGRASFLAQSGTLTGLRDIRRGMVVEVQPEVTARLDGARNAGGAWRYGNADPDIGGNVTWGVSENLTLNATVRPDFSQVEADAGQLVYDPRQAIAFPESRPFFLEGSERFRVPNRLIYTRQIVQPDLAFKANGTLSGFQVGFLAALDERVGSPAGDHRPRFGILRVQKNVGAASSLGFLYTDRTEGPGYNRVVGADARLVLGPYTATAQGAGSFTEGWSVDGTGHLWDVGLERAGRRYGFTSQFRGTSADFVTRSGFLNRAGTASLRFSPRMTRFGEPGGRVETWTSSFMFSGSWLHDALWDGGTPEDIKFHWNNTLALRGGWSVTASLLLERFYYPPYLYADYAIERPTATGADTVAFTGTPSIGNVDFVFNVSTPQWNRVGASFFIVTGRDENFDEWAPAYIVIMDAGLDWRPTDQLRISPTYARQQYIRPDDRSTVRVRDLPRLKVEYQVTRSVFLRAVAQYDARRRDALRDDTRTGLPILLLNPTTGVYEATTPVSINDVQADLLFAWEPNPGTVLFAGYGSTMSEDDSFRFRDLERARDGFFVKLSYLLRN